MLYIKKAIPTKVRIAQLIINVCTTFKFNSNINKPIYTILQKDIRSYLLLSVPNRSTIVFLIVNILTLLLKNTGACYDNY